MRHVSAFAVIGLLLTTAGATSPTDPTGDEDVRLFVQGMDRSLEACEDPSVDIVSTRVTTHGSHLIATLDFKDANAALSCAPTTPLVRRGETNQIRMVAESGPHQLVAFTDFGAYIKVAGGTCTFLFVTETSPTGLRWEIPLQGTVEDFCDGDEPHAYSLLDLRFDASAYAGASYSLPYPIDVTAQTSIWSSDGQAPFSVTT